jgi:hypothetical protein
MKLLSLKIAIIKEEMEKLKKEEQDNDHIVQILGDQKL